MISSIPPTTIALTQTAIGVDIGGTKISSAYLGQSQELQEFQQQPTPTEPQAFLQVLVDMIQTLKTTVKDAVVEVVGIATAGIVNPDTGDILGATGNLPALQGIPSLKKVLEEKTGLSVTLENDANAAAYGEYWAGGAKGFKNVLMVTLGTGVGTGIILNGKILHGAHFSAGEGGHIFISMAKERPCTCGKWDCWEAYASGTGLRQTTHQTLAALPNPKESALMASHTEIPDVTNQDLIAAWKQGDPISQQIMDTWHRHVAVGIGSLVNVLDPDVVVIGGGLAQFVNFDQLTQETRVRTMRQEVRLAPAVLGNQAGIVGAAQLALERFGKLA